MKHPNYTILIERIEHDELPYMAYCMELGKFTCYGQGKTEVEALSHFLVEKDEYIMYLNDKGKPIPNIDQCFVHCKVCEVGDVHFTNAVHCNRCESTYEIG